jgi:hypothetical protein
MMRPRRPFFSAGAGRARFSWAILDRSIGRSRIVARVTWYFDFISPYAYLGLHTLGRLPPDTEVRLEPILLAGVLKH